MDIETNIPGAATVLRLFSCAFHARSIFHCTQTISDPISGLGHDGAEPCLPACKPAGPPAQTAPPTAIQFTLDRPLDASDAPFVLASTRGLFRSESLAVATNIATGPADAIARVASGSSDLALVDINVLMRFRDKADAAPVKAVFVLFNKAPYAIIARKSRGVRALSDIEGKTLGVADGDFSIWFWPALAHQNGIKTRQRQADQIQPGGARADAVGGPGRCRQRIFISGRGQFEGPRRARG